MSADYNQLGPYYRNGKLFLPEHTVTALISAGLEQSTAEKTLRGLALDDQQSLRQVRQAVRELLGMLGMDHPIASALTSADSHFALTGIRQRA